MRLEDGHFAVLVGNDAANRLLTELHHLHCNLAGARDGRLRGERETRAVQSAHAPQADRLTRVRYRRHARAFGGELAGHVQRVVVCAVWVFVIAVCGAVATRVGQKSTRRGGVLVDERRGSRGRNGTR